MTMTKFTFALAALGTVAAFQAHAETAATPTAPAAEAVVVADADGTGNYSFDEVQLAYPTVTADQFKAADTDGDGVLSAEELKAAEEAKTFEN
jgi:hypothetical protein